MDCTRNSWTVSKPPLTELRTTASISVDDLAESLDEAQTESLIIALDRAQRDYEFTERLAKHFVSELQRCAAGTGEPFDIAELLPEGTSPANGATGSSLEALAEKAGFKLTNGSNWVNVKGTGETLRKFAKLLLAQHGVK